HVKKFVTIAPRIIDLSADFRLKDPASYQNWYKISHPYPELLKQFIYGIPELYRNEITNAHYVSSAGCNATAVILALYPLFKNRLIDELHTVIEVKAGSSEGGNGFSASSHHPERSNCIRSYKPTAHRHIAEMLQELSFENEIKLHFSATSIDMVRGIVATSHVFLKDNLEEKDLWKLYRSEYGNEPFIRIVKEKEGHYRYPEPKLLIGTNFCDIGFEKDPYSQRAVIISAIDNLMKGAAGQAVQAFNIMHHLEERTGLEFSGLHPI
ncbi:MAG: N-acetyl-gamma-glutamyl-phosphate reductase, partial [Candidatus Fischerbacteria bacterium RBG_13_37_8]